MIYNSQESSQDGLSLTWSRSKVVVHTEKKTSKSCSAEASSIWVKEYSVMFNHVLYCFSIRCIVTKWCQTNLRSTSHSKLVLIVTLQSFIPKGKLNPFLRVMFILQWVQSRYQQMLALVSFQYFRIIIIIYLFFFSWIKYLLLFLSGYVMRGSARPMARILKNVTVKMKITECQAARTSQKSD